MNVQLSFIVLAVFTTSSFAKESPPEIKVYSQNPVVYGKENILICHVRDFYPEDISIKLLKNGKEIPGAKLSNLGFNSDLTIELSNTVRFTPERSNMYACHVKHMQNEKTVVWEPDV